ncbi:MAG: MFS transporter [Gemmatimonadaceae bacterium]
MSALGLAVAETGPAPFDDVSRRRILTVLFVGVFMAALDTAVIAPAIPALRAAFGVDNRHIGLVTIVFSLCSLSSTALMANLSDRFGRRAIYLLDIAGFALGSLLVARSSTFGMLLVGRAVQGLGAGGITPTASAVVGDAFPTEQRGRILGLIGATYGIAFLIGPVIASLLLVVASWQWIFLINLPIAVVVFAMGARALPSAASAADHPPFDYAGITVLTVMLTSLMLGINRALDMALGQTLWPLLLCICVCALPVLIWVERRAAKPIVPMTLFTTRQLRTTWALCVGAGFGMGSVIFIASVAVAAFHTPSNKAGLLLLPLVLCSSLASMGFGRMQNRIGARVVMLWGFGTLAAGSALIGFGAAHFAVYMLATLFIGTGVGIVVGGTLRTVVLDEVDQRQRGSAQALVNIGIAIGNLLVVAVLSALADRAGGGLPGLSAAYLTAAAAMVLMMTLSLSLRSKA